MSINFPSMNKGCVRLMVVPFNHMLPVDEFLRPRRTFEVIVDLLKGRIFAGEYRVGDRLPAERDLAESLGIGRPSVREAYRALELIGIVEVRKGKDGGAFICAPSSKPLAGALTDLLRVGNVSIHEVTEARLVIEREIGELALARATPCDIAGLRAMVADAIARASAGIAASADNIAFHQRLAEIAGNPILVMVLASIMDLLVLLIRRAELDPGITQAVAQDHRSIIDALEARDQQHLRALIEEHIRTSNARLKGLGASES